MLWGRQVPCEPSHPPLLGHRTGSGPWLPTNPPVSLSSGVLAPRCLPGWHLAGFSSSAQPEPGRKPRAEGYRPLCAHLPAHVLIDFFPNVLWHANAGAAQGAFLIPSGGSSGKSQLLCHRCSCRCLVPAAWLSGVRLAAAGHFLGSCVLRVRWEQGQDTAQGAACCGGAAMS